jgi:peptidyl-prolyl cis-trans isomerase SurA
MMSKSPRNLSKTRLMALALLALAAALPVRAALAQSIVATVNGDPVTTYDLAERAKLLKALGMPATPEASLDSMIKSRVEATEINKFGIKIAANELAPAIQYFADRAHVSNEVIAGRIQASNADKKHVENFLSIHMAFNLYARARNRAVEVSSADIDAELANNPKIAHQTSFVLRQVLMAVPAEAGMAGLQQAAKQMETVRARFTSCETGAKLVSDYPTLIVRDPVTRTSEQIGEQLTGLLEKTPVGHVTPPSRDSNGIAALALCSKSAPEKDTLRDSASARIMSRNVQREAEKLYEELRTRAVIVKNRQ